MVALSFQWSYSGLLECGKQANDATWKANKQLYSKPIAQSIQDMSTSLGAQIFSLPTSTTQYSLLHVPSATTTKNINVYNVCMLDVSASMQKHWNSVLQGWNEEIAPKLIGSTDIYTFGSEVQFRRHDTFLLSADFDADSTDLTGALQVIRENLEKATQPCIRVILITDGSHNASVRKPEEEIALMKIPEGKTIEVYLLGVGDKFPVEYSVNIRSRLHNGSATCPTLFWSSEKTDVLSECRNISEEMSRGMMKLRLSLPAKTLPLVDESKDYAYAGEYLLYEMTAEKLVSELLLSDSDGATIPISSTVREVSGALLVEKVFKQWNSLLIQRHRNKLPVPIEIFDLMKDTFLIQQKKQESEGNDNVKSRLRKSRKNLVTQFHTLMNQSQKMISTETKFESEIELAKSIFRTSVQSKYDNKLLNMRGYREVDWVRDVVEFKRIYLGKLEEIRALPEPQAEDCCRVLLCSFVSDLKDKSFLELLSLNKMEFLFTMSITGIPAYAPVRNSSQINCWTLSIHSICSSPYEILSQRSMETSLAVNSTNVSSPDKEIILQEDDLNSKYNIIVPIIPKIYCETLKCLVRTNVFCIAATFSILKNPLIVDNWCHIAALACVWLKSIEDYPKETRPEFVKRRIEDVEATARLYSDRRGVATFTKALIHKPQLALMTESNEEFEGMTLRSDSLIKPAFFLHLAKEQLVSKSVITRVIKLVLVEYLGRCLSSTTVPNIYTILLTSDETAKKQHTLFDAMCEEVLSEMHLDGPQLLKECYSRERVKKHMNKHADAAVRRAIEAHKVTCEITPNLNKLLKLRNLSSAGNISWSSLVAWAGEILGPQDADLKQILSTEMICMYLLHALQHTKSSERMSTPLPTVTQALTVIAQKIRQEGNLYITTNMKPKVIEKALSKWQAEYNRIHSALALPLSKQQMVAQAQALGVSVTLDSFSRVYQYRQGVGLSLNCCHVGACPHFLRPDKSFNCHLEAERRGPNYPHGLHLSVSRNIGDAPKSIDEVLAGSEAGTSRSSLGPESKDFVTECVKQLEKHYLDMKEETS